MNPQWRPDLAVSDCGLARPGCNALRATTCVCRCMN